MSAASDTSSSDILKKVTKKTSTDYLIKPDLPSSSRTSKGRMQLIDYQEISVQLIVQTGNNTEIPSKGLSSSK